MFLQVFMQMRAEVRAERRNTEGMYNGMQAVPALILYKYEE